MRVIVEFVDNKGFWHQKIAKSKKLLMKWLNDLEKGTEIHWKGKCTVFVSQQYIK